MIQLHFSNLLQGQCWQPLVVFFEVLKPISCYFCSFIGLLLKDLMLAPQSRKVCTWDFFLPAHPYLLRCVWIQLITVQSLSQYGCMTMLSRSQGLVGCPLRLLCFIYFGFLDLVLVSTCWSFVVLFPAL